MKNTLDIHIVSKDGKFFVFHPTTLKLFSVTEEIGMILKFYEIRSKDIRIIAEKLYKSEQYITVLSKFLPCL